jgi:GNAT superfamily N-acetyltransferase
MSDVVVRCALRREIEEIEQIGVAAYAEFRSEVPAAILEAYFADLRDLSNQWDQAQAIVAEIDGRIAGSVMFYADASTEGLGLPSQWAGFRKLAVAPRMRAQGLGRKLVEHCVGLARKCGATAVGIHTTSFMTAARRIYSDLGFRRCPSFDRKVTDLLNMDFDDKAFDIIAYKLELD